MRRKILVVEDEFIIAEVLRGILHTGGYQVCDIADTVEEAEEIIERQKPDFVLLDIYLKGKLTGIDLAHRLNEKNVPFLFISANSNSSVLAEARVTNPYGFVIKPFREKDVLIALDIAIYRFENNRENGSRQSALLQKMAAEILAAGTEWEQKLLLLGKALQPYLPFEFLSVEFKQDNREHFCEMGFLRIGFDEYQVIGSAELMTTTHLKSHELAMLKANDKPNPMATWYDEAELNSLLGKPSLKRTIVDTYGLRSHLSVLLSLADGKTSWLNFYSRRPDGYCADHLVWFGRFRQLLVTFMEGLLGRERNPLSFSLPGAIKSQAVKKDQPGPFDGIIGSSHLLLSVFDQVMQVSGYDSSVLILGETGTGKEYIAERIHALSPRKDKPFIKVNCAALPATLIDSELFGHEKGAFTGALDRRLGRFERAHGGTIFLDEMGELPLESQSKLLRVLQEKEIERIGGKEVIRTDARIIVATNRDLDKEVAEGRFRLDLFYRINVFPIHLPPLRARKEDIPLLAAHFVAIYASKTGKNVRGVSPIVLEEMTNYHWPGNIRELENLIERSVLLAKDEIITNIALPTLSRHQPAGTPMPGAIKTMVENEREHILNALRSTKGKIWGEGGAASLLNLPPTTLNSKMKKLGISKNFGDQA